MYKKKNEKQPEIEDFYLPFGGKLNKKNRWVLLSEKNPWEDLEREYAKKFLEDGMETQAKSLRMVLGALIMKEKLLISDREVVEQIRETPYLQYFIGMSGCVMKYRLVPL